MAARVGDDVATMSSQPGVGPLLRDWRKRQRRTQLDLALDAGISARHLSFVETGRSMPSAEMVLRLAEQLEVPFRERNHLLLAAGYAPAFPERSLEDPELAPVREALDLVLTGHEPYPALVIDGRWNIVAANSATIALAEWVDPGLLEPPNNLERVMRRLVPRIVNLGEVMAFFGERLGARSRSPVTRTCERYWRHWRTTQRSRASTLQCPRPPRGAS